MKQKLLLLVVFAMCCFGVSAQQLTISGKVTDEANSPLVGATVVVLQDGSGTVTNTEGDYLLKVSASAEVLFEYMGYEPQTIKVSKAGTLNVKLVPSAEAMEEVVVVGYGIQRKADLTGSVSTVNFDESMSSRPVANASTALAGLSAGVQVHQGSYASRGRAHLREALRRRDSLRDRGRVPHALRGGVLPYFSAFPDGRVHFRKAWRDYIRGVALRSYNSRLFQ